MDDRPSEMTELAGGPWSPSEHSGYAGGLGCPWNANPLQGPHLASCQAELEHQQRVGKALPYHY